MANPTSSLGGSPFFQFMARRAMPSPRRILSVKRAAGFVPTTSNPWGMPLPVIVAGVAVALYAAAGEGGVPRTRMATLWLFDPIYGRRPRYICNVVFISSDARFIAWPRRPFGRQYGSRTRGPRRGSWLRWFSRVSRTRRRAFAQPHPSRSSAECERAVRRGRTRSGVQRYAGACNQALLQRL